MGESTNTASRFIVNASHTTTQLARLKASRSPSGLTASEATILKGSLSLIEPRHSMRSELVETVTASFDPIVHLLIVETDS